MTYEISVTIRMTPTSTKRIPCVIVTDSLDAAVKSFNELVASNRYTRVEVEQIDPIPILEWTGDPRIGREKVAS